jgi:hypothetical protein
MIAYEFYHRDQTGADRLIGVLPERRKNPGRITHESIMNWVRMVLHNMSEEEFNHDIYFVQVEI